MSKSVRFEPTPNPNAVKCVFDQQISDAIRSYFSADQASDDVLATALFGIDGVTNVLIHQQFISICRRPESDWSTVRDGIQRVLAANDLG